ncbi:MAG: prolyl oligopeptidase family serine peptidase [Acidobacteria bacterium]|nr:prolyl oligopeptidase family serine peptidase [Acidobacteriota bacterium]
MTFKPILVFAACLALAPHASGRQAPAAARADGSVVGHRDYSFPSYEEAVRSTEVEEYASKEAYETAVGDRRFEFQKLLYLSDGLRVVVYVYKPVRAGGAPLPAIIFNRGDIVRGDVAPELVTCFHRLASAGFVVLAPMYRQSDGGEGRDEVGGADLNDLLNVPALAKSLGFVDTDNLFLYGESRGGMMTYQAVRRGFPANAAAVFGALTDMDALIKFRPQVYRPEMLRKIWPDFDARREEIVSSRSAVRWPEALNVPLLIMHGGADWSVSPAQSLALAQKLQELGKTFELIVYAGDGHILSRNQEDRDRHAVELFKGHMKRKP